MFHNIVTYHVYHCRPLPPNDALTYQYILTGNGIFVRVETGFFRVCMPIARCVVRGLEKLEAHFQLTVPRIPAQLLHAVLTDARCARGPDEGLNEVLYQFHHHHRTVQVKKPPQHATGISVMAAGDSDPALLCDLHSHGNMPAFFSRTDNADEQGARVYAVMGKLDIEPEIQLRVGAYGYWLTLPVTAIFTGSGPFKDLYQEKQL